jgi:hypothetical protein
LATPLPATQRNERQRERERKEAVTVTDRRVGVEPIPTITNMHKRCTCARSFFMKDVAICIMILKFIFNGEKIYS